MKNLNDILVELKNGIKKGDFADARIVCEKLLRDNQDHVEINFLLGLIYNKLNLKKRSQEQLEKTLYLDPNYYDALVELSLFFEKIGKHTEASNFRERAFRISNKTTEL